MALLILLFYLPIITAAISGFQVNEFVGTLLIFDGHTHDRSVNRNAYFLSEVTGTNQSITFIQFLGKLPPPQAAGRRVIIQGQKVIRSEDNRVIVRATSFTLIEGITTTQTASQTSTTSMSSTTSSISPTTNSTFDYSISITPASLTISPGQTATYAVSIALVRGTPQLVSLGWKSNSGLPVGTSVSLKPTSGNPSYAATLVVTTTAQATAGTYDVVVRGFAAGGGLAHESPAMALTVLPTTITTTSTR